MPDQKSRAGQGRRVRETVRERAERTKEERLRQMQKDIDEGRLVIRQMTPKEREQYPPHAPLKKRAKNRSLYRA